MAAADALLTAAAVHAGFQLTVTVLVYPALARPGSGDAWERAHRAHTRAITPLVVLVYGGLAAACAWSLWSGPDGWTWVALAAAATAGLVTATVAGPAHGRLARGYDAALVGRLLRADRVRAVAALVAAAAAWAAL